jgi:hypothetical protein
MKIDFHRSIFMSEKCGFVYIWYDSKYKRYYIGSHWGYETDRYICSSMWMRKSYQRRSDDFKRRILKSKISSKEDMHIEEQRWISMIKKEEIQPYTKTPRYYNLSLTVQYCGFNNLTGKKIPCSPERAAAISKAKKGKPLTEEHKVALRKPKTVEPYSEERKELFSQKIKDFWESEKGQDLKEKRAIEGNSEESKQKISKTLKEMGHKPSKDCLQASIKKCSKTYRVISPSGEELIITNLKAFAKENGLIDINMVRKWGSKGWKAYLIT